MTRLRPVVVDGRLARAEAAAAPRDRGLWTRASYRGLEALAKRCRRFADRDPDATLEDEPVGDRGRPEAALDAPDRHGVGQIKRAHERMRDARIQLALELG